MSEARVDQVLHVRYSRSEALEHIKNRYTRFRSDISEQVAALQTHSPFLDQCASLYKAGYKDWHILATVYNIMLNLSVEERYGRLTSLNLSNVKNLRSDDIAHKVYPSGSFVGEAFTFQLQNLSLLVLTTWGFQIRRQVDPEAILRFAVERLGYFEEDLPHDAMFALPLGDWPSL